MAYKTITESCYFKTGRTGVVFETLDQLKPNLFDNNKNINNDVFNKSSKFKFTLVDARKSKGAAISYNLDPNEVLLLNYLLSDAVPESFKKRVGAYGTLSGPEQLYMRQLVETFDTIDFTRFDRAMDYSAGKTGTVISFQKNILNFNSPNRDDLLVKKFMLSYEEAMNSASKWKITIEEGIAKKDTSKGNGLNIVKYGTYKETNKTHLLLQANEIRNPISEAATRVATSRIAFYSSMKRAEEDFTRRKFANSDFEGERIDIWNPQGVSRFVKPKFDKVKNATKEKKTENKEGIKEEIKEEVKNEEIKEVERICSDCKSVMPENAYNYSTKVLKKPLCFTCQKKVKK